MAVRENVPAEVDLIPCRRKDRSRYVVRMRYRITIDPERHNVPPELTGVFHYYTHSVAGDAYGLMQTIEVRLSPNNVATAAWRRGEGSLPKVGFDEEPVSEEFHRELQRRGFSSPRDARVAVILSLTLKEPEVSRQQQPASTTP